MNRREHVQSSIVQHFLGSSGAKYASYVESIFFGIELCDSDVKDILSSSETWRMNQFVFEYIDTDNTKLTSKTLLLCS